MTRSPRPRTLIALSPHLDDVALAAAGTLLSWPGRRLLVTVFSADRPSRPSAMASALDAACGLGADAMAHRRAEDVASCAVLGSEPVHLGQPEALDRRTVDGAPVVTSIAQLFDCDVAAEPRCVEAVADAIRERLDAVDDAVLLVPVGRGGHRDHLIVRAAAESLDVHLCDYYEDQPYGWRGLPTGPPAPEGFGRVSCPLRPPTWRAKLRSLACHRSQMGMLWGEGWRRRLAREHARRDGIPVESLWRVR